MNYSTGYVNKRRRLYWFLIPFVLIGIGLAIVALVNRGSIGTNPNTSNYQKTADAFLAALTKNDSSTSFNLLSERLGTQVGGQDAWGQLIGESFSTPGVNYKLEKITEVNNPDASYGQNSKPQRMFYVINFPDGKAYTMSLVVKNEGDSPKIEEYNSFQR